MNLFVIGGLTLYFASAAVWLLVLAKVEKAHRGQVDDDPVVFAAKDWQSIAVLIISALIFAAAFFL